MPTWSSFDAFGREVAAWQREVEGATKRRITKDQADKAQAIFEAAAKPELGGDLKFSGWAPTLDTQVKKGRDDSHLLIPTRSGAGPITVLFQGRNQGNAGGFAGPGINRRTGTTSRTKSGGLRKVRAVKARRWNGTTRGKLDPAAVQQRFEREAATIAEQGLRRTTVKHFDVN